MRAGPSLRGRFITVEGGEGAGKSTQVRLLAEALHEADIKVVVTREPGGAPVAEEVRALLVRGPVARWSPTSEALLHYAARREHLDATIRPALAAGTWVISDRFADSTMAYQGYGQQLGRQFVERLHRLVVGGFAPDLTVILDLPVEQGLARAALKRNGEDRYERMSSGFHERVRSGFLAVAELEPQRCAVIDASRSVDEVQQAVRRAVGKHLGVLRG